MLIRGIDIAIGQRETETTLDICDGFLMLSLVGKLGRREGARR